VLRIRYFLLSLLMGLSLAAICGQAPPDGRAPGEEPAPAQRRADLRQALKAVPVSEVRKPEPARSVAPASRQLSPKERADLRNLLREQGTDARPEQRQRVQ